MKKEIPYSTQSINQSDVNAVKKVMYSKFLTQGPVIKKFEYSIAKKVNAKFATAFNSATSALHIGCIVLGFKKGDILWTVPNTFVASCNCARLLDGKVDFVDINPSTSNIDIDLLEQKLKRSKKKNRLPKILVPVHFAGTPPEQDKIWKLAKQFNFKILEDASHSLGAKYKNNKVGNCKWSDITVFSLHPIKIITSAEGGVATTNNYKIQRRMQILKNHGITKKKTEFINKSKGGWYYEQQFLGLNYRMNEISAALGLNQLNRLNKFVKERNKIARFYNKHLSKKHLYLPSFSKEFYSSFHLYVIKIKNKNYKKTHLNLFNYMRKNKILANVHYLPVHLQPYYKKLGFKKGRFPESEKHADSALSIPIYPYIKKNLLLKIINTINYFLKYDFK